uniref:Uncharacterized protein n=1 Tax=Panagrolaimus sp. PS1159 TaxID=55785 RepID=A0AC35EXC8_9BILA
MSGPNITDEEFLLHTNYSKENFKLLKNNNNEEASKRIAVFEHKNRRYVRVYAFVKDDCYQCIECYSQQKLVVKAKLSSNGEMFKVYEPFSHICSPKRYLDAVMLANAPIRDEEALPSSSSSDEEEEIEVPVKKRKKQSVQKKKEKVYDDKWKILDSTKFEYGKTAKRIARTRLIVFEKENNVQIYGIDCNKKHYKCLKCNVAKAYVTNDTVRILQDHSCPLQSYAKAKAEQEKITKLRIVQSDEFEYGMNQRHEPRKRLIIFESNNRKLAREYGYNIKNSAFVCLKCHPKFVAAKVKKDKNGNEYVEVSNAHRCKPKPYKGIKAEQESLKKASEKTEIFNDFKYLLNTKGVAKRRLMIFPTKDHGYVYYRQTDAYYICMGCSRDPHNIRTPAYVIKDKNGNECIKANMLHVCEMVSYEKVLDGQQKIKERRGLS